MLFAQPRQATKAAARAELCYIKDKVRMLKHAQAQSSNNCDTRSTHTIGRKLIGMKIILFWYELPTVFAVHSSLSETGPGI